MTLRELSKELEISVERVRQLVAELLIEGEDYILRENERRSNEILVATSGVLKLRARKIKKAGRPPLNKEPKERRPRGRPRTREPKPPRPPKKRGRKPKISPKFAQKQAERAEKLKTDIIHEKKEN